jgi:hypothetical protein
VDAAGPSRDSARDSTFPPTPDDARTGCFWLTLARLDSPAHQCPTRLGELWHCPARPVNSLDASRGRAAASRASRAQRFRENTLDVATAPASLPVRSSSLAQSVEQAAVNRRVPGSSPGAGAMTPALAGVLLLSRPRTVSEGGNVGASREGPVSVAGGWTVTSPGAGAILSVPRSRSSAGGYRRWGSARVRASFPPPGPRWRSVARHRRASPSTRGHREVGSSGSR